MDTLVDLNSKKLADLRNIAKVLGIKNIVKFKKKDLIEAIEQATEQQTGKVSPKEEKQPPEDKPVKAEEEKKEA